MVTAVVTFHSNKPPITERFRAEAEVVPVAQPIAPGLLYTAQIPLEKNNRKNNCSQNLSENSNTEVFKILCQIR